MAEKALRFRVKRLDPNKCTLTVKLDMREMRARLAVGIWLIKLGARVIGLAVKVEAMETGK